MTSTTSCRSAAVEQLTLIIEAIVENYGQYKDFNSTTTQSDRGELYTCSSTSCGCQASYDRVAWNIPAAGHWRTRCSCGGARWPLPNGDGAVSMNQRRG